MAVKFGDINLDGEIDYVWAINGNDEIPSDLSIERIRKQWQGDFDTDLEIAGKYILAPK